MFSKNSIWKCLCIVAIAATFNACSSSDNPMSLDVISTSPSVNSDRESSTSSTLLFTNGKPDANGNEIGNGNKEMIFNGTQTLNSGVYELKGIIRIARGAKVYIAAGTTIKCDTNKPAALIVEKGGALVAEGSAESPIVFTSSKITEERQPGDWVGIIVCGSARNNLSPSAIEGANLEFGGSDDLSGTGLLRYVRIEYAGKKLCDELSPCGFLFASTGKGLQVDHVEVSHSGGDSFRWIGGDTDCRYLLSNQCKANDFCVSNGYRGNVQFGISIRNLSTYEANGNGIESMNASNGLLTDPTTQATFSNMTFINTSHNKEYPSKQYYHSAINVTRSARVNCYNSIFIGWPVGVTIDNYQSQSRMMATEGKMNISNNTFVNVSTLGSDAIGVTEDVRVDKYASGNPLKTIGQRSFTSCWLRDKMNNKEYLSEEVLKFQDQLYPTIQSPINEMASFDNLDSWFARVTYLGALSTNGKWISSWTSL